MFRGPNEVPLPAWLPPTARTIIQPAGMPRFRQRHRPYDAADAKGLLKSAIRDPEFGRLSSSTR